MTKPTGEELYDALSLAQRIGEAVFDVPEFPVKTYLIRCGQAALAAIGSFAAAVRAEAIATLDREQPTPAIFELQDRVSELEEALQVANIARAEAESAPTWDDGYDAAVAGVRRMQLHPGDMGDVGEIADCLATNKPIARLAVRRGLR